MNDLSRVQGKGEKKRTPSTTVKRVYSLRVAICKELVNQEECQSVVIKGCMQIIVKVRNVYFLLLIIWLLYFIYENINLNVFND